MSASHELLAFDRHPSEYLGVLPQLPISLGGKIVNVDVIVVQDSLDFNMLLGHDYVYAMSVVVSCSVPVSLSRLSNLSLTNLYTDFYLTHTRII
jgi:hypothetical protein